MYCVTFLLVIEPADQVQHHVGSVYAGRIADHVAVHAESQYAHIRSCCCSCWITVCYSVLQVT